MIQSILEQAEQVKGIFKQGSLTREDKITLSQFDPEAVQMGWNLYALQERLEIRKSYNEALDELGSIYDQYPEAFSNQEVTA